MPTYEYTCDSCGHHLELSQKMNEKPLIDCPACCEQTLQRGPGGGIGLLFQGSGFYVNDYDPNRKADNACCPCAKDSPCSS